MKVFISFRYTGEDPIKLAQFLTNVQNDLSHHDVYCSFWEEEMFQEKGWDTNQIYLYCLEKMDEADHVVAFAKSPERSKGMLLEAQYAKHTNKIFTLLIEENLEHHDLRSLATHIIEYKKENLKNFLQRF